MNAAKSVSCAQRRYEIAVIALRSFTQLYARRDIARQRSLHDAIAEHSNFFHFELDDIAGLEKAQLLEPAAVADRAGCEELAGMQRLGARRVRDAVLELPVHVARVAAAPLLAVHPRDHLEAIRIP